MQFLLYTLFALLVVVADQVSKYFVVKLIPLFSEVGFIPGVLGLTYVQNDGAAFSSFRGMQGLFLLIFLIFTVAILYEYFCKPMAFTRVERWCIAAVYGGGVGNMIDRVRLGYVVDMIETKFMDFPVFNVADCFITCGCILMMVSLVFFNKKFWAEEKKNAPSEPKGKKGGKRAVRKRRKDKKRGKKK